MNEPSDRDKFICPHCGESFRQRAASMYSPRILAPDARLQVIDTWNIPYSTGLYVLAEDDVPKADVEEFANENAHFPFWPLRRLGVLWAKETWDD